MRYRSIGDTRIEVSEIGFGLWSVSTNWWGTTAEKDAESLLRTAFDKRITFFDIADTYGEGYGERLLAKSLGKVREKIVIATKFGYDFYGQPKREGHEERRQNFSPQFIRYALDQSLKRLETDYVDLYQLHNPKAEVIMESSVFETLEDLKSEGKIREYGVALGPAIGWLDVGELAMKHRRPATIQTVYNILEQEPGRQLFRLAEKSRTGILTRVPHASGALDGKFSADTVYKKGDHRAYRNREWLLEALKKVERLRFLVDGKNRTLGQVALKFALAENTVSSVLPTITSMQELDEYSRASDLDDLTPEELQKIRELYDNNFFLGDSSKMKDAL